MLNISDRKWMPFLVGDIFNISTGCNIPQKTFSEGNLPRISAKDTLNGITQFTSIKDTHLYRLNKNCVSVSFLGSAFYHPYLASYDMKIHSLRIKDRNMNRYIGLFIATECRRQFIKFSYGNQLSSTDLPKQRILLPVSEKGLPDWDFMENYMKEKEQNILKETLDTLSKRLIINDKSKVGGVKNVLWKIFDFTEVFIEIQRGKRLKKADHEVGDIPYVSSTSLNNGVDEFVGNKEKVRKFGDCLTLANSGSVGSTFYHQYEFVASDHVTQLKRSGLDKYAYLFLAPMVQRLSEKYSFNREINDDRIKREKLLLPANDNGEIDFDFMSDYMKQVENKILKSTIDKFLKKLD